jgi:hypothetical protein
MWIALIKSEVGVVVFGPWDDAKDATTWMSANFSGRKGVSAVIMQIKSPDSIDPNKPLVI